MSCSNLSFADSVAECCYKLYHSLPQVKKLRQDEWTLMSAVVCVRRDTGEMAVVSMGTGTKCVGRDRLDCTGQVLNDSHAEVVARRGLVRYLYGQIMNLNMTGVSDVFVHVTGSACKVQLKGDVGFCFFTTKTPCGDASIIRMNEKDDCCSEEDVGSQLQDSNSEPPAKRTRRNDVHRTGAKCLPDYEVQDSREAGVGYHVVGVVRTKPGRGVPTLSLSCSDKIARWNVVGLQGALLSHFLNGPITFDWLIVGGGCPFSKTSADRAINERVDRKTVICQSSVTHSHQKSNIRHRPCPWSLCWCNNEIYISVNGKKQGVTLKNYNESSSSVAICKRQLLGLFYKAVHSWNDSTFLKKIILNSSGQKFEDGDDIDFKFKCLTYGELKSSCVWYQSAWKKVKNDSFKIWSRKNSSLLMFWNLD